MQGGVGELGRSSQLLAPGALEGFNDIGGDGVIVFVSHQDIHRGEVFHMSRFDVDQSRSIVGVG